MKVDHIKFSPQRNKLATALKIWRKTNSHSIIAKHLKISKTQVSKILGKSAIYNKTKPIRYKRNYKSIEIKIKHSKYRKRIAACLKLWRIQKSIIKVAKILGIKTDAVFMLISSSKMYKKYMTFKKSLCHSANERRYILTWAKRIWLIQQMGGKCNQCNDNNFFTLEFHHLNNLVKKEDISSLIRKKRNWESIKKEAKGCVLLCRNCHQNLHNPNPKSKEIKKALLKLKNASKCKKCGYKKNMACLDFHHKIPNEKSFQITMIRKISTGEKTLKKHIDELEKCDVLCANCHMMEHINIKQFNKLKQDIYIKISNIQ